MFSFSDIISYASKASAFIHSTILDEMEVPRIITPLPIGSLFADYTGWSGIGDWLGSLSTARMAVLPMDFFDPADPSAYKIFSFSSLGLELNSQRRYWLYEEGGRLFLFDSTIEFIFIPLKKEHAQGLQLKAARPLLLNKRALHQKPCVGKKKEKSQEKGGGYSQVERLQAAREGRAPSLLPSHYDILKMDLAGLAQPDKRRLDSLSAIQGSNHGWPCVSNSPGE
ncbi:hypothetical protein AMTR_s00040p00052140 [Amborella trichopoda]|uniref:Uncharacterized protein n=1 Tax=Amborella trichopoda TaxID=13333 RepID=W1PYF0_AMBTC|nr:hypothetical protein AMTR_s00040p00052140 [Amborella trichopoda]